MADKKTVIEIILKEKLSYSEITRCFLKCAIIIKCIIESKFIYTVKISDTGGQGVCAVAIYF